MVDAKQLGIVLKIAADRQAANQAAQVVDNLDQDLAAVGKTSDTVSQRLARISRDAKIEKIGNDFGKMAVKIRDTDKAAAALQKRLESIGATDDEIQRATGAFAGVAGTGGDGRQRLSPYLATLGREVKSLPAVRIPGAGALSTDAVAKMVGLIGTLPPVAGALIPVLGGVATAFVALETVTSKSKESLTNAVNANKTYYELIGNGTGVKEGQNRLKELQKEQAAAQLELASITTAQSQAFKDAAKTYGDAGARLLFGLGNVSTADDELAKRQDELTKSLNANSTEQEGINRALNDGTLASNDYRKALEAEAKIKSDAALASANDEYNRQLKLQQEGLMSSAQLMGKITDSIQQQNATQSALSVLEAEKARGKTGLDTQIEAYKTSLGKLGGDITRLYKEFADRRAIEDAIQHEKDLAAARKEVDKINDDVQKATEKRSDDLDAIAQKFRNSLADLKSAFDNANLEAEIERQQKLADLAGETADKQREEDTKLAEDRVKIQEDYAKRIKEIERDYSRSSAEAIQDRDAVALDAAKQKRADELEDARQDRDDKFREREREYRQEMRQLQKSNADKIAEINREFQREAEQRARKYEYDRQQLQISAERERATRQAAYEKQLADLRSNLLQHTSLWQQAGQIIVNYAKSVKDSINNLMGGGTSGVVNGAVSNPSSGFTNFFANGGTITKTGFVYAHAGETILNRRQQQGFGGVNLSINGMGMNRKQVEREIVRQFNQWADGYDRG